MNVETPTSRSPFAYSVATCVSAILCCTGLSVGDDRANIEFFEKRIRPVLVQSCYKCHSSQQGKPKGGLRLDSRNAVRKGGETGPAIVPGKPEESLLIEALRYESLEMPPKKKLPDKVIADFVKWIKLGAPDSRDRPDSVIAGDSWPAILKSRADWWSLQPVVDHRVPDVRSDWPKRELDRFILAKLESSGLRPAPPASPRTLIRRLFLVLTGLPPAAADVERYLSESAHDADAAYEALVGRLLASPHFGERWARHWMDVVRYTETHGNEWNYEVHHAWRYRDYLIRAFNADVPYDQFVSEHIAGDLLQHPRWNEKEQINESMIGTSFFRFGEVNHDDCVSLTSIGYDILDNQIDTLSKAFQATTIACARCHHHKMDAVSTYDYYALLGILKSSRLTAHTIDAETVNAEPLKRLRELKPLIRAELARHWQLQIGDIGRYLLAADATIRKSDQSATLAEGLDMSRLEKWVAAMKVEKPGWDHPLRAWLQVDGAADVGANWKQLAQEYADTRAAHAKFNNDQFVSFADFRKGTDHAWKATGHGLRGGDSQSGEFTLSHEGDSVVTCILPAGRYTHVLSEKLNGTLRSPVLTGDKKRISFQVLGEKTSAVRLISNNCQLNYANYRALTSSGPTWVTFEVPRDARALYTFAELVTKFDNPKFPDQLGTLGGDKTNDRIPWAQAAADPRSYFGIMRAVLHEGPEPPKPDLSPVSRLFADSTGCKTQAEVADRYAEAIRSAVAAWAADEATDDDVYWLSWVVSHGLLDHSRKASPRLAELVSEYRAIDEQEIQRPRLAAGMADFGNGYDHPVFERGNFKTPGKTVKRRYLEVLSRTGREFVPTGSGRLQLADRIASPDNPLTARVMVNRVWHHLFGTGIVRTVDDFGHVGELPSHPQLLDYLTAGFVAPSGGNGSEMDWSIKNLIREIVLSQTFRMSSRADATAKKTNPNNRLLHHYPARRLEAEAIRDSILAVSGRLQRTLYGMSIHPFREKSNTDRRLFAGPLDGDGRRSVYIKVNLMEGPKFLSAFDFPGGKIAQGRRDVTNVPAQALTLLNDRFVLQQAGFWADRLTRLASETVAERLDAMFREALGRPAAASEIDRFENLVGRLARLHQTPQDEILSAKPIWKDVAHVVFNLKEFIYIP